MTTPMLRCENLDVAYGPVQVLFGVDLDVHEREVVGLLGTNGAGKSTLLRAICGLTPVRRGKIWFEDEEITNADPAALAGKGIGFMPGGRGVFPGLSVAENLRMAGWLIRKDPARLEAAVERAVSLFPILERRRDQRAALLSGGQQQMLALAQALVNEPRLLMIDELSLGLAPVVVGELMGVVERLTEEGTTIILVEQSVNIALALTRRAVFMEKGEVRFSGDTAELASRSDLVRSVFIGGPTSKKEVDGASARGQLVRDHETVLSVSSVSKRFGGIAAVDDVSFNVRAGEVVGILGANGAGKTTLLDLLTGFVPVDGGRVTLHGHDVTDLGPHQRATLGMARSFQDARLFAGLTVDDNMAIALEQFAVSREPFAAAFHLPISVLSESLIAREVEELTSSLGLVAFRDKFASQLSTGSRRVVEFGSLVAQRGDVLLLDEPTGGLAQAESEALGPLLRRMCDATGATLVVVEHDVPLLVGLCDRLIAMELGAVIADGPPHEVIDNPRVIASYLGKESSAITRSGGRDRSTASNGHTGATSTGRPASAHDSSPASNGQSATSARRRRGARTPTDGG
jgi:branched-chain amino acid transport system ATP-binding protein